MMYGEVNACHEVIRSEIAGLVPSGVIRDCANCSVYNWTIGHVIPVTSEIGASDGDLEEQYVLARYRVWIDAAEYKRLIAYIDRRKATKGSWHALFNNCVTFGPGPGSLQVQIASKARTKSEPPAETAAAGTSAIMSGTDSGRSFAASSSKKAADDRDEDERRSSTIQ